MAALPAISKAYSVRANVPYQSNVSALAMSQSVIWSLKENMKNTLAGGTVGGTRDISNSVWGVKGSCAGGVAALDGVDRLVTPADVIWAADGVTHSYIILENTAVGLQLLIDCVGASNTNVRIAATEIAVPFVLNASPIIHGPASANEFEAGNVAPSLTATFLYESDTVTGNLNWTHFVTTTSGMFFFLCSRTGLTRFTTFIALQRTVGNHVADTRNAFLIGHSANSGRGAPLASIVANTAAGCVGRSPNGTINNVGGIRNATFGATAMADQGTDVVSGNFISLPCEVGSMTLFAERGFLPDFYITSGGAVGGSVPSAAAQERVIAGDFIIPFPVVPPTM